MEDSKGPCTLPSASWYDQCVGTVGSSSVTTGSGSGTEGVGAAGGGAGGGGAPLPASASASFISFVSATFEMLENPVVRRAAVITAAKDACTTSTPSFVLSPGKADSFWCLSLTNVFSSGSYLGGPVYKKKSKNRRNTTILRKNGS